MPIINRSYNKKYVRILIEHFVFWRFWKSGLPGLSKTVQSGSHLAHLWNHSSKVHLLFMLTRVRGRVGIFDSNFTSAEMYRYFTAECLADRHQLLWGWPPAQKCPFACFSTDSVGFWTGFLPASPRSLIHRHFPRGLCSNLIIFKCVSLSYSGQHQ